ncbi:MAG: HAD family hydrolase [Paludibacteraceae bacterium]|nr:HAD family hydrolase [Paludibacteraceae bacterium]
MKIKAVIFDLDGTLYNNSGLPYKIAVHSLGHIRMLMCERSVRRDMAGIYFGDKEKTYNEFFKRIAVKSGKSKESVSKWYSENYLPLQVKLLQKHFKAYDWVLPTLDKLRHKGVLLACYSDYGFISEKLMAIGIPPEKFDLIIDAPSAGGFKPCRESLETVTKLLGVSPKEALVIGDREDTDGLGAKAANMHYKIIKK